MESETSERVKPGRGFDSAYSFSFSIAIGLVLFIGGLVISLTLGQGTVIGLIFGIPMLIAGLVLPLIMMRDMLTQNEVKGVCPYCSAQIRTSDATLVVLYFMHVRYSARLIWVIVASALFWMAILFALTFSDYWTRGWT